MERETTRREFLKGLASLVGAVGFGLGSEESFGGTRGENRHKYATTDFSRDSEEVILARMIWGEARGCSEREMIAVGYTAVNRANDGKRWNGETIKEAILKPKQYSCFNPGDPNREKLKDPEKYDAESFRECLEIARGIISGKYEDPTHGATHYFNPRYANPSWARSPRMEKIGRIKVGETKDGKPIYSKHVFYREK